jgi:D-alanyl-D-alanine carboxypeptidase
VRNLIKPVICKLQTIFLPCFSLAAIFLVLINPAQAATYAGIVIDAKTGETLYSHRGDEKHFPASLTKMMTLYMLFEALETGRVTKKTRIQISSYAAAKQPSKLGVPAGGSVSAEQAILSLVTKSANDIAAAIAEHLGGTESGFGVMMTRKARQLGMNKTTFKNASGLPNSRQITTARDMATLGMALRDHFPQYYHYFSTRSFTYGNRKMGNHNRLLGQIKGVDGIKTGYIRASGFNLVTSVETDGRSIVAVVLGGRTGKSRNAQMVKLINSYLRKATKGADNYVIAKPADSNFIAVAEMELPETGPLPSYRRGGLDPASMRVAMAHSTVSQAMRNGGTFDLKAIENKLREIGARKLPVPAPAPGEPISDPVRTASVNRNASTSTSSPGHLTAYAGTRTEEIGSSSQAQVQAEARARSGWQVQIAAVDNRESAIDLLEAARRKAPDLLASVENYTETVNKNGTILYRARFAGFVDKNRAWDTCHKLKRKKLSCLAIEN